MTASLHKKFPFPVGAAIKSKELAENTCYRRIASDHFNSYSTELCFKTKLVHPEPYQYDWKDADELVRFASEGNKRLHGHALVWNEDLPAWLSGFEGDEKAWTEVLRTHVEEIVGRYRTRIHAWDVVNEAFDAEGHQHGFAWQKAIGPGYLAGLFNYAHKADPGALLFYNDFDLEVNPVKRKAVIEHLTQIQNQGTRVDGIGLQLHLRLGFSAFKDLEQTLDEICQRGFLVHISELDIAIDAPEDAGLLPPFLHQQAELAESIFSLYCGIPEQNRYGITMWGISDADSWMNYVPGLENKFPLLFDRQYKPKPCFGALMRSGK